jgi:hypothetical protein
MVLAGLASARLLQAPVGVELPRLAVPVVSSTDPGGVCLAEEILAARYCLGQHNVFIQPAIARPISSGESSWTKWTPLTVTSVCAGKLRACSRTLPPAIGFSIQDGAAAGK